MLSLPTISLVQLARLRGRERLYLFLWGLARLLALIILVVGLACWIDWWIDKYRETPPTVRLVLSLIQPGIYFGAIWFWIVRPLARLASDDWIAQRVEEKIPAYGHRLVTSIQLTRPTAKREGMSTELIEAITVETEQISQRQNLVQLADARRLEWSLLMVLPILLIIGGMLALWGSKLTWILLQRQLFQDVDIPRFIQLVNQTPELWPSGDEVLVRYQVTGRISDDATGTIQVRPDGLPTDEYPLVLESRIDEETTIFLAKVPPSTVNFQYRAWLKDGRTKKADQVRFEPRPVVGRIDAWVQLPDYVGKKPSGGAYETYMQQGDILGLPTSKARIQVDISKPVLQARVIRIARKPDRSGELDLPAIPMQLDEAGKSAEATIILQPDLLAYRVEVIDSNNFMNATPPRRGIALAQDDPPRVVLLPERFADMGELASEDTEVEGMPVPLGKNIRIGYTATSPLGLRKARLVYRINEEETWNYFPLNRVEPKTDAGPFDLKKGVFQNSKLNEEVEFYTLPSTDLESRPDDLEGGGRLDFKTRALQKRTKDGTLAELEIGDRVEFYIEVFDKNPDPNRLPGRSESRIKAIVTDSQFIDWVVQTLQSESRLRQLEEKQQGVFKK